jgi:hypothetical protein
MTRLHRTAAARGLLALVVVAIASATAAAKAPTGVATLEDLQQKARQAEAEAQRRALEASKDPNKEAIEAYKTKKTKLEEYQKLVQIAMDAKTAEVQDYRIPAAGALVERFAAEDLEKDPRARQIRIEIALELCELLKAPASDDKGLIIADTVFSTWYRAQVINSHWKKEAKLRDRQAAYAKIRKFLKNSEKD